jgi:hypothetical protein
MGTRGFHDAVVAIKKAFRGESLGCLMKVVALRKG